MRALCAGTEEKDNPTLLGPDVDVAEAYPYAGAKNVDPAVAEEEAEEGEWIGTGLARCKLLLRT